MPYGTPAIMSTSEPFAVLLGDTLIESNNTIPVMRQLIDIYNQYGESVVALEEVEPVPGFPVWGDRRKGDFL